MFKLKSKYSFDIFREKRIYSNLVIVSMFFFFLMEYSSTSNGVKTFQILIASLIVVLIETNNQKRTWLAIVVILFIMYFYNRIFNLSLVPTKSAATNVNYANYSNIEVVSTTRFIIINFFVALIYCVLVRKKNDH
jgi:hypothetical protein